MENHQCPRLFFAVITRKIKENVYIKHLLQNTPLCIFYFS